MSDIILGIIPDNGNDAWNSCKHLTINKGIMNQMVLRSTVQNPQFKVDNLALQILSKLGNVPWVLNKPLPFCDVIMGADIARQKKRNGKGTRNEMGIPRWFEPNGDLLKYRLVQSSIDGERIPMNIIRECTPVERFGEKNILFHLDGKRGVSEVQDFLKRGNEINAEIMVVEVIKLPPFRIYQMGVQQTEAPNKGQWIRISNNEAVVVSTTATHQIGTPRPLHLKCTSNISIEDAVLSVLALSDLNYASKQQARCPITTHSSHNISKMLLNDIRPPVDEGTNPWWL